MQVDWFKWNVLTSTGTTSDDDALRNIVQNNLLHVYVVFQLIHNDKRFIKESL